jgi:hypothetical protein
MSRLNILQLHQIINEKKQRKTEAFDKVLSICNKRITAAAEEQKMRTFIIVPEFVVGYPIFNMNECLEYIVQALKKNGFLVKYYFPKMLYVSWDFQELKEDKKPIVAPITIEKPKALLTSNITTNKKGKLMLNL